MQHLILQRQIAEARGMVSISVPYQGDAAPIAAAAVRDLLRAGIPAALVPVKGGLEIWRARAGMRGLDDTPTNAATP